MAEPNTLSKQDAEKVIAWLDKHWKAERHCPICRSNNWKLQEDIVSPVIVNSDGAFLMKNGVYPQILLISDCGYTIYFNAIVLGIVKGDGEASA